MKKRTIILLCSLLLAASATIAQTPPKMWDIFGRVKFVPKYNDKLQMELYYPQFTPEIKALAGKIIEIQGYVIPLETGTEYVVLSRYPYSQCFFCGGAGPESISAIFFKAKPKNLKLDRYIAVKGKLELNETNIDMFNFILKDAEIVEVSN